MSNIIEITDFTAPELDIYTRFHERQLYRYHEPEPGIFVAESPNVILRALEGGYDPVSFLMEDKVLAGEGAEIVARYPEVPVFTADLNVLKQLTGFGLTRGALSAMRRRPLPPAPFLCAGARRVAVLENITNPTNIGAIFRSAAALSVDAVLLPPDCTDPLYRRATRVSMGTVFQVPWTYLGKKTTDWPELGMSLLKASGFKTVALALCDESISIDDPRLIREEKLAILLGNEGDGLSTRTIASCDYTARIPMAMGVDSLNVAAASAVAFWELAAKKKLC